MSHFEINELNSFVFVKESESNIKNRFNTFSIEEDFDVIHPCIQYIKKEDKVVIQVESSINDLTADIYNNGNLVKTIQSEIKTDNMNKTITLDSVCEHIEEDKYLISFKEGLIYSNELSNDTLATTMDLIPDEDDYIKFFFGESAKFTWENDTYVKIEDDYEEKFHLKKDVDLSYLKGLFTTLKKFPLHYLELTKERLGSGIVFSTKDIGTLNLPPYDYKFSLVFTSSSTGEWDSLGVLYNRLDTQINGYYKSDYSYGFLPDFLIGKEDQSGLTINYAGLDLEISDLYYSETSNSYGILVKHDSDISGSDISKVSYHLEEFDVHEFSFSFHDYEEVRIRVKAQESSNVVYSYLSELIRVGLPRSSFIEMVYFGDSDRYINYSTGIKHILRLPYEFIYHASKQESTNQINDNDAILISSSVNFGVKIELSSVTQSLARKIILASRSFYFHINNVRYIINGDINDETVKGCNLVDLKFSLIEAESQPVDSILTSEPPIIPILSDGDSLIDFGNVYLY